MESDSATPAAMERRGSAARLYARLEGWARKPGSAAGLFVVALLESSFIPFPLVLFLFTLCVASIPRAFTLAAICLAGSVCGGVIAYFLGLTAWTAVEDFFIPHIFSERLFTRAEHLYEGNAVLVIVTSAATVFSYKVCALAAGVFQVNFWMFLAASVVGRGVRFFAVAAVAYFFGEPARDFLQRRPALVLTIAVALIAGFFLLSRLLA